MEMSKCIVEGCNTEATTRVGGNDEYSFCGDHSTAWGYYRGGYYEAKGFGGDGLLHKKEWDKAMKAFLEWCRVEVVACTQIANAIIRSKADDRR